jgi:hypothetical protein
MENCLLTKILITAAAGGVAGLGGYYAKQGLGALIGVGVGGIAGYLLAPKCQESGLTVESQPPTATTEASPTATSEASSTASRRSAGLPIDRTIPLIRLRRSPSEAEFLPTPDCEPGWVRSGSRCVIPENPKCPAGSAWSPGTKSCKRIRLS